MADDFIEQMKKATGYKEPSKPAGSGDDDSVARVLDDEFSKLGYSPVARLSILGDVGRENNWNRNIIFGGHSDPKNKKFNRGIISWQGDRVSNKEGTGLNDFLKKEGVYGKGDDDELRGMARFMDYEMKTKFKDVHERLQKAQKTYDASEALRQYIKYVPDGPYNSFDPEFRVKNNADWARKAKRLGLAQDGSAPATDKVLDFNAEMERLFGKNLDKGGTSPGPNVPGDPKRLNPDVDEKLLPVDPAFVPRVPKDGEFYYDFEKTGRIGKDLVYAGNQDGVHIAKNRDGDIFKLDEDAKQWTPTGPQKRAFDTDKNEYTLSANQEGVGEGEVRRESNGNTFIFSSDGKIRNETAEGVLSLLEAKTAPVTPFPADGRLKQYYETERKNRGLKDTEELRQKFIKAEPKLKAGMLDTVFSPAEDAILATVQNQGADPTTIKQVAQDGDMPGSSPIPQAGKGEYGLFVAEVDPEAEPGRDGNETAFRQAAIQAGRAMYGRDLTPLEVDALTEYQRQTRKGFAFSRIDGITPTTAHKGLYFINGASQAEYKAFLDSKQHDIANEMWDRLSNFLAQGGTLDGDARAEFVKLGFDPEQLDQALGYNPSDSTVGETPFTQGVAQKKQQFQNFVQQYLNDPDPDVRNKALPAARFEMGWITPDQLVEELKAYDDLKKEKWAEINRPTPADPFAGTSGRSMAMAGGIEPFSDRHKQDLLQRYLTQTITKYGSAGNRLKALKQEEIAETARQSRIAQMSWPEYLGRTIVDGTLNLHKSAISIAISSTLRGIALGSKFLDDLPAPLRLFLNPFSLLDSQEYRDTPASKRWTYRAGEGLDAILEQVLPTNKDMQQEFLAGKLPQGIGSTIGMIPGGLSKLPKLGISILSSLQMGGDAYKDALNDGATEQQAQLAGMLQAPLGITEIVGMGNILGRLNKGTSAGLWRRLWGESWRAGAREIPEEISQEGFQQTAGNIIKRLTYDPDRRWDKDVFDSMVVAGIAAPIASAGITALNFARNRMAIKRMIDQEQAAGVIFQHYGEGELYAFGKPVQVTPELEPLLARHDFIREQITGLQDQIGEIEKSVRGKSFAEKREAIKQIWDLKANINALRGLQSENSQNMLDQAGIEPPEGTIGDAMVPTPEEIQAEAMAPSAESITGPTGNITEIESEKSPDLTGAVPIENYEENPETASQPAQVATDPLVQDQQPQKPVTVPVKPSAPTKSDTAGKNGKNSAAPINEAAAPNKSQPIMPKALPLEQQKKPKLRPIADVRADLEKDLMELRGWTREQAKDYGKAQMNDEGTRAMQAEIRSQLEEKRKGGKPAKYSNVQIPLSKEHAAPITKFRSDVIDKADVADKKDLPSYAKDGLEIDPHVTVKYGLKTNDPADISNLFEGEKPITVTLGKTSVFPGSEKGNYDVLIAEINSPELHGLNKKVTEEADVAETAHPEYVPHVTIAYLKKGAGAKYAGRNDFEGQSFTYDGVTFSPANKSGKVKIPFTAERPQYVKLLDSLDIPRSEMPQVGRRNMEEFIRFAEDRGTAVTPDRVKASDLKPSQNEYNPAQSAQLPDEALKKPITISSDNRVLDGHNTLMRLKQDNPDGMINVRRVDLPAFEAIGLMRAFPKTTYKPVGHVGTSDQLVRTHPDQDIVNPIDRQASQEEKAKQLMALTEQNKPIVEAILAKFREMGLTHADPLGENNEKKFDQIIDKANRPDIKAKKPWFDVEHIRDAFRFRAGFHNFEDIPKMFQVLMDAGVEFVKTDTDKFLDPGEWGWRPVAVDMMMPNGQLVEFYTSFSEMIDAQYSTSADHPRNNHDLFEDWRNKSTVERQVRKTEYEEAKAASLKVYDAAYQAGLDRLGIDATAARASFIKAARSLGSLTSVQSLDLKSGEPSDQEPSGDRTISGMPAQGSPSNKQAEPSDIAPINNPSAIETPSEESVPQNSGPEPKTLSPAEKKRIAEIDKELLGLSGAMTAMSDAGFGVGDVMAQMKELRLEKDAILGKGEPKSGVPQDIQDIADASDGKIIIGSVSKPEPSDADIFAELLAEKFGKDQAKAALQQHAENAKAEALKGLEEAGNALKNLFGSDNFKSAGFPAFDDAMYEKAKPHFIAAFAHFKAAGASTRELMGAVIDYLMSIGMDAAGVVNMQPYILRFSSDVKAGEITLPESTIGSIKEEGQENVDTGTASDNRSSQTGGEAGNVPSGTQSDGTLEEELPGVSEGDGAGSKEPGNSQTGPILQDVRPPDQRGDRPTDGESTGEQGSDLPADSGSGSDLGTQSTTSKRSKKGSNGDVKRVIGTTGNFYVNDVEAFAAGGLKTKFRKNIEAITTLRTIQAEGRITATPEEQAKLAAYIGWGQFPALFNVYNDKGDVWAKEREELLGFISKEEFESASASTKNAHYTAPQVVRTVWEIVQKLGFKGGNVLETSLGVGNFFSLMPAELRGTSRATGIELDLLSAQISKLLFPKYDIRQMGYQEFAPPAGFYDLAISNVPFGRYAVDDLKMPHFLKNRIHNYFFAKAVQDVRVGGLVAFITSTGTMSTPDVLEYLKGRADLVASIRFPANTFLKEAGTAVVTDLVILRVKNPALGETLKADIKTFEALIEDDLKAIADQKAIIKASDKNSEEHGQAQIRQANIELHLAELDRKLKNAVKSLDESERFAKVNWTEMAEIPDPDGGEAIPINQYYVDNPNMLLGRMDRSGTMYRGDSVNLSRTPDFELKLKAAIESLPADIMLERESELAQQPSMEAAPESMRQGSLVVKDGKVYTREGSYLKERPMTVKNIAAVAQVLKVRDALNATIDAERRGDINEASVSRKVLNTEYDAFVAKHGTIHDNRKLIEIDPDHYRLVALENYDRKTRTVTGKADVFRTTTVSALQRTETAASYTDAINIVLNRSGFVDVPEIARMMQTTVEGAETELRKSELAYKDPRDGWTVKDLYLSGEVRRKLREAKEAALLDPEYQQNVEALEKVQPEDLPYRKITPTLGAAWIPASDIQQFMADMMTEAGQSAKPEDFKVTRLATGDWIIGIIDDDMRKGSVSKGVLGTEERNFADIVSAAIKDTPIVVTKSATNAMGTRITFVDRKASSRANRKVRDIRAKFKRWVWAEDGRRERLHRAYNDTYNDTTKTQWNGSHLTFPGMNPLWASRLYSHIPNAVYRLITQGRLLAAHEVGTGKTNIMIASAMELRRLNLAKKPAIVCLNSNVEQVAETARDLYPGARILAAFQGMDAKTRQETTTRIMSGDWDIVILTHENLVAMPMSKARQIAFIREELQVLRDQVAAVKAAGEEDNDNSGYGRRPKRKNEDNRVVKALEAKIAQRKAKLKELFAKPKDDAITFEETGIDFLMVDEAHAFKNLDVYTTRQGTKGIPTSAADRATNLFLVTRYLAETHNNRGVAFFTGTPISNTTAEAFNMMRYLMWGDLKARGIEQFDSWAANYGENMEVQEMTASGDFKTTTAFRKFKNLDTLSSMLRSVMDVVFADDVADIVRPQRVDEIITTPMSDAQKNYQLLLQDRAEALKHMSRDERMQKGADNWLALGTDAKKMAMDMRLVDPNAADDPNSKTNKMVANVLKIAAENPGKAQLIFSDIGINGTVANPTFSLYQDIINKLVAGGIPRNKIIDFSKFKNGKAKDDTEDDGESPGKEAAMRRLNSGDALIAIGGAQKLGTGVNVQEKVIAMHKLDVKQRPDQDEQETGRGHRGGNTHTQVHLFRYTTQDSFDMFFYDRLKQKKSFIDALLRGEITGEYIDSIDESLDYDTVVAVTASNPLIRERIDVMRDLRQLEEDHEGFEENQLRLGDRKQRIKTEIKFTEARIEDAEADRKEALIQQDNSTIVIEGVNFEIEDAETLKERAKERKQTERVVAEAMGMDLQGEVTPEQQKFFDTEVSNRMAQLPPLQAEKAETAIVDALRTVRSKLKSTSPDYGFRNRVLWANRGQYDFGTIFGLPLIGSFQQVENQPDVSWTLFVKLPSTNTPVNLRDPIAGVRHLIAASIDMGWTNKFLAEKAKLEDELPRIDKGLSETFNQLPQLEELRKKLTRIEIELGGDTMPEGYVDVETRMRELADPDQLKEARKESEGLMFGSVGDVGAFYGNRTVLVRDTPPDYITDAITERSLDNYRRVFEKGESVVRLAAQMHRDKPGSRIFPFAVDTERDQVIFNNEIAVPSENLALLYNAFPEADFAASGQAIYAYERGEMVGVVQGSKYEGGVSEDLLPAMKRAKYQDLFKAEKKIAPFKPLMAAIAEFKEREAKAAIKKAIQNRTPKQFAEPLSRKLDTSEMNESDRMTAEKMFELANAPLETVIDETQFDQNGDRIFLSPGSHELMRRTLEQVRFEEGSLNLKEAEDAEDLFKGQFIPPRRVAAMVRVLREKAQEALQKGYGTKIRDAFTKHADALHAASKNNRTVILYVFPEAIPEELFHQADYLGAADKNILNRHTALAKDKLDKHRVRTVLWEKHFAKFKEYRRQDERLRNATLRAEIPPFLLSLSESQLSALGITPDERADYLLTWFEGYAEKNGIESLNNFDGDQINVQTFIARVKAAQTNQDAQSRGPHGGNTEQQNTESGTAPPKDKGSDRQSNESEQYGRDAGEFFGLNEGEKWASLPATLRRAGIDIDDLAYDVFGDRAAGEEAIKLINEHGIEGTIKLLDNVGQLDVHHAMASFIIQRMLMNRAAELDATDPQEAENLRAYGRQVGAKHVLNSIAAGRFTRAASVIPHSVEGVVYSFNALINDKTGGERTISPEKWIEIEALGRELEEKDAKLQAAIAEQSRQKRKIKRLEDELEGKGKKKRRSRGSVKNRKQLVAKVKEEKQANVDKVRARLKARFGDPASGEISLKSALYNSHGAFAPWSEIKEIEVEDRGNYTSEQFDEWAKEYNIRPNDQAIWVTPDKKMAATYADSATLRDEILAMSDADFTRYLQENEEPHAFDSADGVLITESDDGDNGFLFVRRSSGEDFSLKSALEDETDFPIDDFAEVGAMMLTEGIAGDVPYLPEDFKAEMQAEFGDAILPYFQEIYKAAWEKRDEWLREIRKEDQAESIRSKYGEDLEDWEVDEIIGQNKERAAKRRAIENIHKLSSEGKAPKVGIDDMRRIIANLAPNAASAIIATVIAEGGGITDIASAFDRLGVEDGAKRREIMRTANDVFEKAKAERQKEKVDLANEVLQAKGELKQIEDLRWTARNEVRKTQQKIADEMRHIRNGELSYRWGQFVDASQAMRTMMATFDFSGGLRQGGFFTFAKPEAQAKAFADMFKSVSETGYGQVITGIENHPLFVMMQRAGVDFAMAGRSEAKYDLMGEELFRGEQSIEKIPLLGKLLAEGVVKPSERSYTAVLDSQRAIMANIFFQDLMSQGLTMSDNPAEFRKVADFINIATGRGTLPGIKFAKVLMALPLFAPRYTLSRLQLLNMTLNPVAYYNMPPAARKIVAKSAVRFYGTTGAILGAISAFGYLVGASVNWDDDDSDFLKIKIGNAHYDIFAGTLQPAKLIVKIVHSAIRTKFGTDNRVPGEFFWDAWNAVGRFLRGKLSPLASLTVDALVGEDYVGNKFELWGDTWYKPGKAIYSRLMPLTIGDAIEAYKVDGLVGIAKSTPAAVFGLGVSTYKPRAEQPETEAEKLAAKMKSWGFRDDEDPDAADTSEQYKLKSELIARARRGEDISADLADAKEKGLIDSDAAKSILARAKKTLLEDKAGGLTLWKMAKVLEVASPSEREQLLPLINKKMKNADVDNKLDPALRRKVEALGGRILGDFPMPQEVKAEFDRFKIKTPDVGENLTLKKNEESTKLSNAQYDKYRRESLEEIYTRVQRVIESPIYKESDPDKQERMIRKAISKARALESKETKQELREAVR